MWRSILLLSLLSTGCRTYGLELAEAKRARVAAAEDRRYAERRERQTRAELAREDRYRQQRRLEVRRTMADRVDPKRDTVVAVFDVGDPDAALDEADRYALSRYVAASMLANTRHRIVPPDRLRAALVETKRASYRACFDETCQVELGRRLAADRTAMMTVFAADDHCRLGLSMFDLATETATWSSVVDSGCTTDAYFTAAEQLVRALAAHEREAS